MIKHASTDHPILEILVARWSPYGWSDRPVSRSDLRSLFEAARWAASAFNEQPWRYVVATRDEPEEFERLLSCLVEGNQAWAAAVPALALGIARSTFSHNGKPNRVALHDLGLAAGNICAEATARGISVHQMAGILPERARELYQIPEEYDAQTALAFGYAADPEDLEEPARSRDTTPRTRRPLDAFVFGGSWGRPAPLVAGDD